MPRPARPVDFDMPAHDSSYGAYLASREWGIKKRLVRQRSGGNCERCGQPATEVHHLTYERLYNERLTDLLHVCHECHEFLSGNTDYDPAEKPVRMNEREWAAFLASPTRQLFERHMR